MDVGGSLRLRVARLHSSRPRYEEVVQSPRGGREALYDYDPLSSRGRVLISTDLGTLSHRNSGSNGAVPRIELPVEPVAANLEAFHRHVDPESSLVCNDSGVCGDEERAHTYTS